MNRDRLNYFLPVFYAILACFLWGGIFFVTLFLQDFETIDVVLGRYLCFGLVSITLLFWQLGKNDRGIFQYWKQAGMNAVVMNFIYFSSFTMAMRWADPADIAIIIGLSPITIGVGDMLLNGNISLRSLVGPMIFIFVGILLMNTQVFEEEEVNEKSLTKYSMGIMFGLLSLAAWTWYVIFNTRFLQKHPDVNPKQWTLLVGTITLAMALIGFTTRLALTEEGYLSQFTLWEPPGQSFLLGIVTLGIVCSWIAYTFWNMASAKLPSAVSGQIAVLEMVFSLLFVYLWLQEWPTIAELVGIGLILIGIWMGITTFYTDKVVPVNSEVIINE